jgi:hypothetical protein
VPDPPPPPGTTLEPPPKPAAKKPSGDYDAPTAVTRSLAKGAIGVIDFIPDMLTYAYNATQGDDDKSKLEMPSSYLNRKLDEHLTPPDSDEMKASEEVTGALAAGGATGLAQAGKATAPLVKKGIEAATKPLTRVATRAAEEAHIAGIKLPPSYIGGPALKTVQEVSGGPKLDLEFSKQNAPEIDRLAKLSLGLHPEQELDEATFQTLKDEAYKPYEQVRTLGMIPVDPQYTKDIMEAGGRFASRGKSFVGADESTTRFPEIAGEKAPYLQTHFDAGEALDEMRMLRKLSRDNLKNYNPGANALGMTQREISNALENQIDRYATKTGQDGLVDELRGARTQLAKIAAVEDSMGTGGHVRAADFKRMLDKGMPLTDSLKTIAETAKHFPRAVQELTAGDKGVFSAVDYLFGGSGIVTGHPAVAGASMARPLSRWALKSEGVQKSMMSNLHKTPSKAGTATRKVAGDVGKTLKKGAGAAARGGTMLGSEDAEEEPVQPELE